MAHEWDRGVLNNSSWHGLEQVLQMLTAMDLINAGEDSGAWPINIRREELYTDLPVKLKCPMDAIVAEYKAHDPRCLSAVGGRYEATDPEKWRELIKAAVEAGAKPSGAFSLRDGTRVLATFEIPGGNGIRNQLVIADAYDGSMKLTCGFTSIRVVCANTLSAAMHSDGKGMARLRHTASLNDKIVILGEALENAIESGQRISEMYAQAEETRLNRDDAMEILFKLFPEPDEEASKQAKTRAKNKRDEALRAAQLPVNKVGESGTLATLWNAATYIVDRKVNEEGKTAFRNTKRDRLDAMLFGTRGTRVAEIEQVMVQVLRPDGTEESVLVDQAIKDGVPPEQMGSALLESILQDME